jgi:hypothetical protein
MNKNTFVFVITMLVVTIFLAAAAVAKPRPKWVRVSHSILSTVDRIDRDTVAIKLTFVRFDGEGRPTIGQNLGHFIIEVAFTVDRSEAVRILNGGQLSANGHVLARISEGTKIIRDPEGREIRRMKAADICKILYGSSE